jgi:hypothetical protein
MASGSDPAHIRHILRTLEPLACGLSLCGAGAGGFGALILKAEATESQLREAVDRINQEDYFRDNGSKLSVHSVQVDTEGLISSELQCLDHGCEALKAFLM